MTLNISEEFKNLFISAIDTLMAEGALSTKCKLVYENVDKTQCPNCEIDPMSGRSANLYKAGGAVPFEDGQLCPFCNGDGYTQDSDQEDILMLVVYNFKQWVNFTGDVHTADGMIQTIAHMEHISKIKAANRLIVDTNLTGLTRNIYTRQSDPEPAGLGNNHYIFTFWKKI